MGDRIPQDIIDKAKEMDLTLYRRVLILNDFGVCGTDKVTQMQKLSSFLTAYGIEHETNNWRLVWLPDCEESLKKLFRRYASPTL